MPPSAADPLHRIEMIDTEIMLLAQIWQAGEDATRDGHSVCLTKTIELTREREECERALGYDVLNTRQFPPCPDCRGRGSRILNPDWPAGDLPYSEKCSTCSGTGVDR